MSILILTPDEQSTPDEQRVRLADADAAFLLAHGKLTVLKDRELSVGTILAASDFGIWLAHRFPHAHAPRSTWEQWRLIPLTEMPANVSDGVAHFRWFKVEQPDQYLGYVYLSLDLNDLTWRGVNVHSSANLQGDTPLFSMSSRNRPQDIRPYALLLCQHGYFPREEVPE